MKKLQTYLATAVALAATSIVSGHAQAAAIGINASQGGKITFSACDFEGGITVNAVAMGSCGVGSGGATTLAANSLSFSGSWIAFGATSGPVNVYFVDVTNPNFYSSLLSYSVSLNGGYSNIVGTFTTNFQRLLGSIPSGATTTLAGGSYNFSQPFLGGVVNTSTVPTPSSLALVGLAMAAAGVVMRRRA